MRFKKMMGGFILTAIIAVLYCTGACAESQIADGVYTFRNAGNTELVMGVTGGYYDDATELICITDDDTNYEKFQVKAEDTYSVITAVHSDKYIRTAEEDAVPNGILRQYMENDNVSGHWNFVNIADDTYQIKNENGMCVGVEDGIADIGKRIVLKEENPQDTTQTWIISPAVKNENEVTVKANEGDYVELEDGIYEFSSAINNVSCWAMSQDPNLSNPVAIIWERTNDNTQKFVVQKRREAEGAGFALYSISPIDSDKVLQRNAENMIDTADYIDNMGTQLWQFVYGGYGRYLICCVDGVFASCADGDTGNGKGVMLQLYEEAADSNYLKWFIRKID